MTPGVKFINILHPHFAPIFLRKKITKHNKRKLRKALSWKKLSSKLLMKSTPGPKKLFGAVTQWRSQKLGLRGAVGLI